MARSCQRRAHFKFEDLKRAGHRDQNVLANTKMMNLSKWLERLGELTLLYGPIHPQRSRLGGKRIVGVQMAMARPAS